jgi:hypothetical protein
MAAGARLAGIPKPPEPGVIISITEPAGAWNAPLHGSLRDLPSGVVSMTTAAAPACPPSSPNGGDVIRSIQSEPTASAPCSMRHVRTAPQPPRNCPAPPESGFTA